MVINCTFQNIAYLQTILIAVFYSLDWKVCGLRLPLRIQKRMRGLDAGHDPVCSLEGGSELIVNERKRYIL
jgi:hypothetical protein